MYPAAFEYCAPNSLAEAVSILDAEGADGDARPLAGGQSLLPLLRLRLARPALLVDLRHLSDLAHVREEQGGLRIGALATHAALEDSPLLRAHFPLLAETAGAIGDRQVRNLGTIGGSLAHADPAADWTAAVLAHDAVVSVHGPSGERTIRAADFLAGPYETTLASAELLTAAFFPRRQQPTAGAYEKFPHPASRFAVAGVAALLSLGSDGRLQHVRVAVTGVAPAAYRARALEDALEGQPPTDEALEAVSALATQGVDALEDTYATADYRLHLGCVIARRALARAVERLRASP